MLLVYALPTPAPLEQDGDTIALTVNGKACLAVLAFAVTLWVTEALPFAVTSLFVLLLIPIFGIADYETVVAAGFGNPIITFFIGVLILSSGFGRSGLGARLVLHVLRIFGTRTDRVLLGFLTVGAMLSMWITDMAVAAILLPLGVGVLRDARLEPLKSNFGRALMIACAYGPLIRGDCDPGWNGCQPDRHQLPARAGRRGDLIPPVDDTGGTRGDADAPARVGPPPQDVSTRDRAAAAGGRRD